MTNKSRLNWPTSLYEPDLEHSTDNNSSLDPDDDFRLACRNVSDFFPQKSQDYSYPDDQTTRSDGDNDTDNDNVNNNDNGNI